MKIKALTFFSITISFIFLLGGCTLSENAGGLKWLDEKVGDFFNETNEGQKQSVMEFMEENEGKDLKEMEEEGEIDAQQLTKKQKEQIDEWFESRGLNRYGDDKSAVYTGGTPLFNEETGESIDRYDYILNKFPDILEKIGE